MDYQFERNEINEPLATFSSGHEAIGHFLSMELKTDLAGTFSKTVQVGGIKSSQVLQNAGLVGTYFPEDSRVYLEEAVPSTKINLSNSLTTDKFNVFLRNVWFGEVTEATTTVANQQVFSSKLVTD